MIFHEESQQVPPYRGTREQFSIFSGLNEQSFTFFMPKPEPGFFLSSAWGKSYEYCTTVRRCCSGFAVWVQMHQDSYW